MMRNELPATIILDSILKATFASGTTAVIDGSFVWEIGDFVEQETTQVLSPEQIISDVSSAGAQLLDFGCGSGNYRNMLESFGYKWVGINYASGMAPLAIEQSRKDPSIIFYDGLKLPFADKTFDAIYSFQTFEHIQDIGLTFSEIYRVMKPGAHLVGAVSYLEQIHDYSTYNFTPYGFKMACIKGGLRLIKVYPKFDVFSWMLRRLMIDTSQSDDNSISETLYADNNIGQMFIDYAKKMNLSCRDTNLLRLMYCSHFTFHVLRPGENDN